MRRAIIAGPVLVLCLLASDVAHAQSIGVKAGALWSGLRGDGGVASTTYERRQDWSAGLFARLNLGPVRLQPEVLYSRRGAKIVDSGAGDIESRFRMDYLEIPVLLRLGGGSTAVYVGGYGAVKVSAKVETRPVDGEWTATDISSSVSGFDYGVLAGLSFSFGKFGLDGRYVLGLRRLFNPVGQNDEAPDLKHSALALYATLQF